MKGMELTALDVAKRFMGIHERSGDRDDPFIQWCHSLCGEGYDVHDEVPWCSAFAQVPSFLLGLPRSGSPAARSWLKVGTPIALSDAEPGFDVVIFKRGTGPQPGPEVLNAPGHVGFFVKHEMGLVQVLGGNQGDKVSVAHFFESNVLGVRRLI